MKNFSAPSMPQTSTKCHLSEQHPPWDCLMLVPHFRFLLPFYFPRGFTGYCQNV